jgi:ATP-binding protein involved in chromosome partitioning
MSWIESIGVRLTPANFGPMKECQAHGKYKGPCGDTMEFWLLMDERKVVRTSFTTDGCETSVACGSVAANLSQGRTLEEVLAMQPAEILEIVGMKEDDGESHCALLATRTLTKALSEFDQAWKKAHGSEKGCGEGACGEGCCESCEESCGSAPASQGHSLDRIKHRVLVLSGKGGVGKSTVATHLAMAFAAQGLRTGLLDVDIHGPSVPKMLGLDGEQLQSEGGKLIPMEMGPLKVMSMGFALGADQAAIWRGPMKASVVDQFVRRTQWDDLDVLVVDCPPGTGDEHLSLVSALGRVDGAVIVTTPQDVATLDAQKAITFCHAVKVPVLGVVENMSGLICPSCQTSIPVFSQHGGRHMATAFAVPFLGSIPLDPSVTAAGDRGTTGESLLGESPSSKAFQSIFEKISSSLEGQPVG